MKKRADTRSSLFGGSVRTPWSGASWRRMRTDGPCAGYQVPTQVLVADVSLCEHRCSVSTSKCVFPIVCLHMPVPNACNGMPCRGLFRASDLVGVYCWWHHSTESVELLSLDFTSPVHVSARVWSLDVVAPYFLCGWVDFQNVLIAQWETQYPCVPLKVTSLSTFGYILEAFTLGMLYYS